MPFMPVNGISAYYEIHGSGRPLVLIHGGWVSHRMWQPQVEYFASRYRVLTYDVRGHGLTGASPLKKYSVELFAADLREMLEKLHIKKPALCGLSMGGMIAQCFASRWPDNISALILADTAASTELTLNDKLLKYVLAPKWLFIALVRLMGMRLYSDFASWTARVTRSKEWFGQDEDVQRYVKEEMLRFETGEFNKIFEALYDFKLQDLAAITAPALIINGEYESKSVFKHMEYMHKVITGSSTAVVPRAGHTSNMENPVDFNRVVDEFLQKSYCQ